MRLTHHYPARRLADGTWEIRDLDIFAECSRLNPHTGEVDVFDAAWLARAADAAARHEADGYLAPVHLGHHDPAREDEPPLVGFLRDMRVDDTGVENVVADADADADAETQTAAVLRATITSIPESIFLRIRDMRIPYRSVEIHSPDEPGISSLALLQSTVPFFRFPITRVTGEASADVAAEAMAHASAAQFTESAGRLHCAARFCGRPLSLAGTLERVRDTIDRVSALVPDEPRGDAPPAPSEADVREQIAALAAGGHVFSEPAVRELAEHAYDLDHLFACLRRTLPVAPVADSRHATDMPEAPTTGDRELDTLLRELGLDNESGRRQADVLSREFAGMEPGFRAIGCSFSRTDYLRSRLDPVCTDLR